MILTHVRDVPVVRLGFGRVLLGEEHPIPAEGVAIPIEGALVRVDPARPASIPSCLITDPDAATASVRALYGEDAAAAVLRVWPDEGLIQTRCTVEPDDALEDLVRLGTVRWCRQFSPFPLDDVLSWLEELTLTGRLDAILEDVDEWADDLERACGRLVDRAGGDVAAHPAAEQLLVDALDLLATTLPITDPISVDARERLADREPVRPRTADGSRGTWEPELQTRLALVAGDVAATGVATVDWYDVRRGLTSMTENNVRWTVDLAADSAMVSVAVEGPPAVRRYGRPAAERERPRADRLAFDAYVPSRRFAVLTGELHFGEETWSWTGRSRVGAAQAALLEQTIDAGGRPSIRVRMLELTPMQNPAWATAHRWTCRGLASARVARDSADRSAAADAWRRAAELWRLIANEAHADACEQLATDLLAGELSYDLSAAEAWLVDAR